MFCSVKNIMQLENELYLKLAHIYFLAAYL